MSNATKKLQRQLGRAQDEAMRFVGMTLAEVKNLSEKEQTDIIIHNGYALMVETARSFFAVCDPHQATTAEDLRVFMLAAVKHYEKSLQEDSAESIKVKRK